MKALLLATLAAFSANAETAGTIEFKTTVMPLAVSPGVAQFLRPLGPQQDGVIVYVFAANEGIIADMIEVTITYQQGGKTWTRTQQTPFVKGGCWPAPCRSGGSIFVVGSVDMATVKATVKPIVWESKEIIIE